MKKGKRIWDAVISKIAEAIKGQYLLILDTLLLGVVGV